MYILRTINVLKTKIWKPQNSKPYFTLFTLLSVFPIKATYGNLLESSCAKGMYDCESEASQS